MKMLQEFKQFTMRSNVMDMTIGINIGAVLGKSGSVRNRDVEFSKKDVPIRALVAEIEMSAKVLQKTLQELKEDDLQKTYPINGLGHEMTTEFFLTHLATHLNYHLGQINYHRRMLDN